MVSTGYYKCTSCRNLQVTVNSTPSVFNEQPVSHYDWTNLIIKVYSENPWYVMSVIDLKLRNIMQQNIMQQNVMQQNNKTGVSNNILPALDNDGLH